MAGAAALGQEHSKASTSKPRMPGPFPGLVVGVEHPGSIANGVYQAEPVRRMVEKGMTALTGAPNWTQAWRSYAQNGYGNVEINGLPALSNAFVVDGPPQISWPH